MTGADTHGDDDEGELADEAPSSLDDVDREAVSRVIKAVEIDTLRLRFSDTTFVAYEMPNDWSDRAFMAWQSSLAYRDEDGFSAHVEFLLRYVDGMDSRDAEVALPDFDPDDPPALNLTVAYEVAYKLTNPGDLTDRDLQHFCFVNGVANAWSFWREYVFSMTGRMGLQPAVVPVLPVPSFASASKA